MIHRELFVYSVGVRHAAFSQPAKEETQLQKLCLWPTSHRKTPCLKRISQYQKLKPPSWTSQPTTVALDSSQNYAVTGVQNVCSPPFATILARNRLEGLNLLQRQPPLMSPVKIKYLALNPAQLYRTVFSVHPLPTADTHSHGDLAISYGNLDLISAVIMTPAEDADFHDPKVAFAAHATDAFSPGQLSFVSPSDSSAALQPSLLTLFSMKHCQVRFLHHSLSSLDTFWTQMGEDQPSSTLSQTSELS